MPSSLGMDLAMLSGNLTGLDGFAVGVRANYPIGRNLAIETGSSYRFQRQAIDITFNLNSFTTPVYDTYTIVSNQLDVNTAAESIQPVSNSQPGHFSLRTVIKGHFIDVPVVLTYQLSPRWKLEAGPQLSYLAGAYQGSSNNDGAAADVLGGSFSSESRKSNGNWYSLSSEQRLESFYFNRFDVGFSGGISYRPAQWLGLRAQVHQGFVDMIKSPNYHLRNQYFGLSTLVYF